MLINDADNSVKVSLEAKIELIEGNISLRRQLIKENSLLLKRKMRKRLATPTALITSVGIGLGMGLWMRPARGSSATPSASSEEPPIAQTTMGRIEQFLARVFKVVAMGRTLATLLPEASVSRTGNISTASDDMNTQSIH